MNNLKLYGRLASIILMSFTSFYVYAESVGQFKSVNGTVTIERTGKRMQAVAGAAVEAADIVITDANSSAGITFLDNSRLSLGANSHFSINQYRFDQTTHEGRFDSTLKKGTLSMISGKLSKHSPDAITVSTPSTILAVRGTEFLVSAGE